VLEVDGLEVSYAGYLALSSVPLTAEAGEVVCLMGANGSGKSSLLNAVSGLVLPRQGTVRFNGEDVTRVPTYQRLGHGLAHSASPRRASRCSSPSRPSSSRSRSRTGGTSSKAAAWP
jgi:branched-chain amino acid transport system ATP-binding protein